MKKSGKKNPTWNDLKRQLANFDHTGLLCLIQDLYVADKQNQAFLHARFGLVTMRSHRTKPLLIAGFVPM
ncbi:MAG TPA: hypothetical protein PKD88_07470 [Nitrosomonas sp.]|nr:hypothetical protein [Nitrosomonas sp.]HMW20831.1 hypothetical protein [Nitrosomonas sp.]HMW68546.1 hypothetical protein [Nitrosomonas sp.]HMY60774.1 hypothetical protein [Nitrosomonas sp.]HMY89289.1 hypothetical protein [Nitrosomonas sp.]